MVFLLGRLSWKGHSLMTLGKLLNIYCSGLPGDRVFKQIVLLGRWSWESCLSVTHGKPLSVHCLSILGDRALFCYGSFTQDMVLKRLFFGDTGEDSALHIHHLVLENRAFKQRVLLGRWSWKGRYLLSTGESYGPTFTRLSNFLYTAEPWIWYQYKINKMRYC